MIDYKSRIEFKKDIQNKTNDELMSLVNTLTRQSRELLHELTKYETEDDHNKVAELVNIEYYRTMVVDKIVGGAI
nr:MAG TPA: hypothetical protein [Caudoviricetes sp.]